MLDICKDLELRNISHESLSSLHCHGSVEKLVSVCLATKPKVLVATAEFCMKLGSEFFSKFNTVNEIGLVCYEEVHCDFLFGKVFRQSIIDVKPIFSQFEMAVKLSITASPIGGDNDYMAKLSGLSSSYYLSKFGLFRENLKIYVKDYLAARWTAS